MKKYELLVEDTITFFGVQLFRIKALISFSGIEKGEVGGYIASEKNLSQSGNAWVSGNAKVYGDADVSGNAKVYGDADVSGNARVYGDAWVSGNADVSCNARVSGNAEVSGNARVYGNAKVSCNARVYGNAKVYGDADVSGNAKVYGDADVSGNAEVSGNARVSGNADYIVFKNTWSSGRYFTYTKSNRKWKVGCFYGSGAELVEKAYKDSKKSCDFYKAYVDFVEKLEAIENIYKEQ